MPWDDLNFSESDEFYEAMLPDFHLLDSDSIIHEEELDEPIVKEKVKLTGINSRVQEIEESLRKMWKSKIEFAFKIGLGLVDLRAILRGDFKRTVIERLPFSYSTAANYINVAETFRSAEEAALFDSKVMYAMATKTFPSKLRQEMIAAARKGKIYTIEEVRETREELKRREAELLDEGDAKPITFSKSEYVEFTERVIGVLEDIVSEIGTISCPEEPTRTEKWNQHIVWDLVEKIAEAFKPVEE